jgi:hypothetical protein
MREKYKTVHEVSINGKIQPFYLILSFPIRSTMKSLEKSNNIVVLI